MPSASKAKAVSSKSRSLPTPRLTMTHAVPVVILIALTVAVYANSLTGEFVFDDPQIVLQNPRLLNIHSLRDVLTVGSEWRQLLSATYGLNYYWSGLQPFGYHIFNLILHVINVLLVYCIAYELGGRGLDGRYAGFVAGAVFGVHTLMSSAVSYIAGRSSVLCAVFYFLALLLCLRALDTTVSVPRRAVFMILAALSGVMAWQAKQEAIALPALVAALLWLRSEKKHWPYVAVLGAIPLIVAAAMWKQLQALLASVRENTILVSAGVDNVLQPAMYFRTYVKATVTYYFQRFVLPLGLNADPHITPVPHWYSPEFIVSVFIFAAIVWLGFRASKKNIVMAAGIAAVLISPLIAYAVVPLADVVQEHRAYIPGLGIALIAAASCRWVSARQAALRFALPIAIVIALSILTLQRNAVFANNVSFWEDAVKKSPQKARSHVNLGGAYLSAQRRSDAIREFQVALSLKPDIHAAYSNIAAIQIDTGQLEEAEKTLARVTQIAPEYTDAFINLAVLYLRKNQVKESIAAANRAIEINPLASDAFFNRGEAQFQERDYVAAMESYKQAVYLRPDRPSFQLRFGLAQWLSGDRAGAEEQFRRLTEGPLAADAFRALANVYSQANEFDKAIDFLKKSLQARPNYPDAHHDLGVIYLRQQAVDQAIEEFLATLKGQPNHGAAVLNLALAHQTKGNLPAARQVLETYIAQFGNARLPFTSQIQDRLASLR